MCTIVPAFLLLMRPEAQRSAGRCPPRRRPPASAAVLLRHVRIGARRSEGRSDLMSVKLSAGILLYRIRRGELEVFLVHSGGPFWAKKDDGAWSIPKGEFAEGQDPVEAAKREFAEETGFPLK